MEIRANLQALCVYLMVVHFIPVQRCVELAASLTGAIPSAEFLHGMLTRAAGLLAELDKRIRALIALTYAVCCDETPLRVGPERPHRGGRRPRSTCWSRAPSSTPTTCSATAIWRRSRRPFSMELTGSVVVHDRYHLYDSAQIGQLTHQLCCQHLCSDLGGASEVYPDAHWPAQIAGALRELMHQANLAREAGHDSIDEDVKNDLIKLFTDGVLVRLSDTTSHGDRPGERKTRLVLEVLRDRQSDVLRFAHDLNVPATSNQAERDLRPAEPNRRSLDGSPASNATPTATASGVICRPPPGTATT